MQFQVIGDIINWQMASWHLHVELLTFFYFISGLSSKKVDWREYLFKRITGTRTIPENFYNQVSISPGGSVVGGLSSHYLYTYWFCLICSL